MRPEQFRLHAEIEDKHWWFRARKAIIVRLVNQLLPPSRDLTIVDVGCGTGGVISALADRYRCIGVDTSEEAISLAKTKFPSVDFICGQAPECLGSKSESVDMFMLLDVLEHVELDRELVASLFGVLKPGGQMVLTVPANMSMWSPQDENYGHFRRYEPEQLMKLWSGLPVTVRLFSYFNTYLYPLVRGIRIFTRIRGREWGQANTDLSIPGPMVNQALEALFSYEVNALTKMVSDSRQKSFPFGVSLVACLSKDA